MFIVNYKSPRLENVLNKSDLMNLNGEIQVGTSEDMLDSNLIGRFNQLLNDTYLNPTVSLPLLNLAFDYYYRTWLNDIAVEKGTSVKETLKLDNVSKFMNEVVPDTEQKVIVPAIITTYAAPYRDWFTGFTLDIYEEEDELRVLGLIETDISASEFRSKGIPVGCCLVEADGNVELKVIVMKMTCTEAVDLNNMETVDLEARFLQYALCDLVMVEPSELYGAYRLGLTDTKRIYTDLSVFGNVAVSESFWSAKPSPMKGYGLGIKGTQTNQPITPNRLVTYFSSLFDPYISQLGLSIYISPIFIAVNRYLLHKLARSLAVSAKAPIPDMVAAATKFIAHDKEGSATEIINFFMRDNAQTLCEDYLRIGHVTFLRPILSLYNLQNGDWITQIGLKPSDRHEWPKYKELLESKHSPLPNIQEWLKSNLALKGDAANLAGISLEEIYKGTGPELSEKALLTEQSAKNVIIYVALYIAQRNQGE